MFQIASFSGLGAPRVPVARKVGLLLTSAPVSNNLRFTGSDIEAGDTGEFWGIAGENHPYWYFPTIYNNFDKVDNRFFKKRG